MAASAKILVVDDDPDMREALQIILESGGYTVVMAEDGEKCLSKLKEEQPDLLILDLLMPRMDGFEVCKALKDPGIPQHRKNQFWIFLLIFGKVFWPEGDGCTSPVAFLHRCKFDPLDFFSNVSNAFFPIGLGRKGHPDNPVK